MITVRYTLKIFNAVYGRWGISVNYEMDHTQFYRNMTDYKPTKSDHVIFSSFTILKLCTFRTVKVNPSN